MDFLSSKQVLKILALGICTIQTDLRERQWILTKQLLECIYELVRKKIFMMQVLQIKLSTLDELIQELGLIQEPLLTQEEQTRIHELMHGLDLKTVIPHPLEKSQLLLDELEQGCQRVYMQMLEEGREVYLKAAEEASNDFTAQMKIDLLYEWNKKFYFENKVLKEEYRSNLNDCFQKERSIHSNLSYDKMIKRLKRKKVNALAYQIKKRYSDKMKEVCGEKVMFIMNTIEKIFFG
jgi:hypothetical protein